MPSPVDIKVMMEERRTRAALLKSLTQYPEWDTYREELEQIEARHMERLVTAHAQDVPHLQGIIMGLRLAWNHPAAIQLPPK